MELQLKLNDGTEIEHQGVITDGFMSEFCTRFWDEIGDDVGHGINNAFNKGESALCQNRGPITPLPKKDKIADVLNNLCPVTLVDVNFKIGT